MGVNHGGTGRRVSSEFGVGDANANCPPNILPCLKISNTRLVALQGSNAVKSLSTPLFQHSIHYFAKVHLQRSPNHHFRRKIFLARTWTKCTTHNAPKRAISSEKFIFFWGGVIPTGAPYRGGGRFKSTTFDQYIARSQKWCKIGTQLLLNTNRNSYVLYRMMPFPVTLRDPNYLKLPHFRHFVSPFISL